MTIDGEAVLCSFGQVIISLEGHGVGVSKINTFKLLLVSGEAEVGDRCATPSVLASAGGHSLFPGTPEGLTSLLQSLSVLAL